MQYCEDIITGIDGSEATFVRYVLDNSEEIDPKRQRPSVLVIPGGGYAMTSDREAEPIAMQFLAAGWQRVCAALFRRAIRLPHGFAGSRGSSAAHTRACGRLALRPQ